MQSGSPYSLVHEMLEAPDIIRRFESGQTLEWSDAIRQKGKLLITGEGSSRIFPSKNMISLSLQTGAPWQTYTEGAEQSAEYKLDDFIVIGASNSGKTKELVTLFKKLTKMNIPCYGITATPGSPLTDIADDFRILSCGPEKAVAATKSVIEQALFYQSLLHGEEWRHQAEAAGHCQDILAQEPSIEIIHALKSAPIIYFSGRNNGVAEELRLKTNEIMRCKSDYLEGTYALHGIEEVMKKNETLVLIEPFKDEIKKYQEALSDKIGLNVIAISSFDTPFPTFPIPKLQGYDTYFQLMAGWNMLVAAGIANGISPDKPVHARKIGNEI